MKIIRLILGLVSNIAAQLLTGIGFMILIGAFVAEIYVMALVGTGVMVLGFFLFRKDR